MMKTSIINHISFILDKSGSMSGLTQDTIRVFDAQIKHLAKRSQELDQETRVSVYVFNNNVECIIFDKDVMRLPSIASEYVPTGGTALIDATQKAIDDLKKTAQLYGDHAFLAYVLTDGEENQSRTTSSVLASTIKSLADNWTVAVLVPNALGVSEAKKHGFSADNIMVWDTTAKGIEEVNKTITAVTEQYMQNRSKGIRGSTSLFKLDTSKISSRKISDTLTGLDPSKYLLIDVNQYVAIKPYVEAVTKKPYVKGAAYYQLTKKEEVQAYKQVCVQNKLSKRVYSGDEARNILGLPNNTVNVKPEDAGKFNIFIQSTSINRKLITNTQVLILK